MQWLNLAQNAITNKSAIRIADLLKDSSIPLSALFLKWNYIKPKGAIAIWEAIENNTMLKTLELSFNPIGEENAPKRKIESFKSLAELHMEINMISGYQTKTKKVRVCEKFSNMFRHNKTLIHADLSHWGFTRNECKIMNEGLKHNHILLGLHFTGNQSNVDPLGFLKPASVDPAASHIISRIHTGMDAGHFSD